MITLPDLFWRIPAEPGMEEDLRAADYGPEDGAVEPPGPGRRVLERLLSQAVRLERSGELDAALERLEGARELAVRLRAADMLPRILRQTGDVHLRQHELDVAVELYNASLTVAELAEDHPGAARALNALGWAHQSEGDLEAARQEFARALELVEDPEEPLRAAVAQNLGVVAMTEGEMAEALEAWMDALGRYRTIGDRINAARVYNNLGIAAAEQHSWPEAEICFSHALAGALLAGDLEMEASVRLNRAALAFSCGNEQGAQADLEYARTLCERLGEAAPLPVAGGVGFRVLGCAE